jgi:hypothetical protein
MKSSPRDEAPLPLSSGRVSTAGVLLGGYNVGGVQVTRTGVGTYVLTLPANPSACVATSEQVAASQTSVDMGGITQGKVTVRTFNGGGAAQDSIFDFVATY